MHRRCAPKQPTTCATTALPLRCRAPLSSVASLHSTEPCSEPELPRRTLELPSWFVPTEPIVTGPRSSSIPLRETVLAHPGLQLLTLQHRLQRNLLHWPLPQLRYRVLPLLLFQRRLRLLSPHPGDTRPGWDLGPLLLCIRDHAGGPCLPSGPGHQARVSHRGLGPSRRLFQLIRVRRPSYPYIRGSRVRCSAAIRFQGMSIFVPETSMESHTKTYRH